MKDNKVAATDSIQNAMSLFTRSIDSLRDFVAVLVPFLRTHTLAAIQPAIPNLTPLLTAMQKLHPEEFDRFAGVLEDIDMEEPSGYTVKVNEVHEEKTASIRFSDRAAGTKFKDAIDLVVQKHGHSRALYESALLILTNSVERFVTQLLHYYYDQFPDAINSKDPVFSLADLRKFGSIEDAVQHLIESRIEGVLRDSFSEWIKFLKDKLSLKMSYLGDELDEMIEVFQRRNIIVHNGGIVNKTYLSRVAARLQTGVKAGQKINIDQVYLDRAIDLFQRVFLLIGADLWKRRNPADETRANLLSLLTFDFLLAERWAVAEGLSYFMSNDGQASEYARLVGQMNYWQCHKWSGRFEKIRSEVMSADFSAKDVRFRLCLFALQDDETVFFELLQSMRKLGQIDDEEVMTWPIFREMRKSERYRSVMGSETGGQATSSCEDSHGHTA